jgi:hypothetical protein
MVYGIQQRFPTSGRDPNQGHGGLLQSPKCFYEQIDTDEENVTFHIFSISQVLT